MFGVTVLAGNDLTVAVGRNTAHVVVDGRQHRDGFFVDIHSAENACGLGDAWQALFNDVRPEVLQMQAYVILFGPNPASFTNFDRH